MKHKGSTTELEHKSASCGLLSSAFKAKSFDVSLQNWPDILISELKVFFVNFYKIILNSSVNHVQFCIFQLTLSFQDPKVRPVIWNPVLTINIFLEILKTITDVKIIKPSYTKIWNWVLFIYCLSTNKRDKNIENHLTFFKEDKYSFTI